MCIICVCMCIHVCLYTCVCVYVCKFTHAYAHVYMCVSLYMFSSSWYNNNYDVMKHLLGELSQYLWEHAGFI